MVESELASLTLAEMRRKTFKLESMITDVSDQRMQLAALLSQLIREKESREKELQARISEMDLFKDQQQDDKDNFWLVQYQRLLSNESLADQIKRLGLAKDDRLNSVLLNCESANVQNYLHVFVSACLTTFDDISGKSEKELISLGIDDYELAAMIVDEVKKVEGHAAPSAPPADEEPSAPPIEEIFCELECCVCMDRQVITCSAHDSVVHYVVRSAERGHLLSVWSRVLLP